MKWLAEAVAEAVPPRATGDGASWAEANVRLPGSARGSRYAVDHTPWTRQPLVDACGGDCRTVTLVLPVQSGKSAAGEAAICYWIAVENAGDVQYNWEDDGKARDRWDKRFERILEACGPVMARAPDTSRTVGKWRKCAVQFPHINFTMQGVHESSNLDSDTIRFQVNEEVHNWPAGKLAKAYNRTTAVWNAVIFNISNAGRAGSQLHEKFLEGTQRHWEVPCPECGAYHAMRTRWDPGRPELGGLRYDAEGHRLPGGMYDYNAISGTVRYQFPCGHSVRDDRGARRAMSAAGRYGEPQNPGAPASSPSYTMEGVSVDYIPWLTLVQEKHTALRALKLGDPEPWWRYLAERENKFYDPDEDRPVVGRVTVVPGLKKDRDGLPNRVARFGTLDRQMGTAAAGELPHWWGVIRDADADGNSRLVMEGKFLTDEDAAEAMTRHGVRPANVVVDSGDDTTHVYLFCLKHGYNAIKGSGEASFAHPPERKGGQGSRKIFSVEKPLHEMMNRPPSQDDPVDEPLFWFYSKAGVRERLHWLRGSDQVKWEVPGDVSKDYREHMEAEELEERRLPDGGTERVWRQKRKRNDLFVCECYVAMLMEMAGLIGAP